MRDQMTLDREAELKAPTRIGSGDWLDAAVCDYEKQSGMTALHYRGLRTNASLKTKIKAARLDLRWWENHTQEAAQQLEQAVRQGALACGI